MLVFIITKEVSRDHVKQSLSNNEKSTPLIKENKMQALNKQKIYRLV